jgi:hypothetical protein
MDNSIIFIQLLFKSETKTVADITKHCSQLCGNPAFYFWDLLFHSGPREWLSHLILSWFFSVQANAGLVPHIELFPFLPRYFKIIAHYIHIIWVIYSINYKSQNISI